MFVWHRKFLTSVKAPTFLQAAFITGVSYSRFKFGLFIALFYPVRSMGLYLFPIFFWVYLESKFLRILSQVKVLHLTNLLDIYVLYRKHLSLLAGHLGIFTEIASLGHPSANHNRKSATHTLQTINDIYYYYYYIL
jgi:hypothetical protein